MEHDGRLRAPYAVLRELFGEADEDSQMDKTSTCFVVQHAGHDITLYDFHKDEWEETPRCRTDPHYVWCVSSDAPIEPFCRWAAAQIQARMKTNRSLAPADRAKLDELVAGGMPIGEAMTHVQMVTDDQSAAYAWPPPNDPTAPNVVPFAPPPTSPVRRRKR